MHRILKAVTDIGRCAKAGSQKASMGTRGSAETAKHRVNCRALRDTQRDAESRSMMFVLSVTRQQQRIQDVLLVRSHEMAIVEHQPRRSGLS